MAPATRTDKQSKTAKSAPAKCSPRSARCVPFWTSFAPFSRHEDVITTTDGQQAVDAARRRRPDAAVISVALSTLTGIEVAEQLRQDLPPPAADRIHETETVHYSQDSVDNSAAAAGGTV